MSDGNYDAEGVIGRDRDFLHPGGIEITLRADSRGKNRCGKADLTKGHLNNVICRLRQRRPLIRKISRINRERKRREGRRSPWSG